MKNLLIKLAAIWSVVGFSACSEDWRNASHASAGLAPPAGDVERAIFQIYTARAWSWRGYFAVHPWVAWKTAADEEYTVASVQGFQLRRTGSAIVVKQDLPDRHWYGAQPEMIFQAHGVQAEQIIARVQALIDAYPYADTYRAWPGPNSNTFVSYLIRNVDEIDVELPPHAIGKDWLVDAWLVDASPLGRGVQLNALGVAGLTLGLDEGIEFNLLGLNFGFDVFPPALKLPMVGRLGMPDHQVDPL